MRIIALPKSGISYNDCFYAALEKQGVEVVEGVFSGGWLRDHLKKGDWLHFHWPSFEYNVRGGAARQALWFLRFAALLLYARSAGARILWTAHNLLPHDRSRRPLLDILGRHLLIALAKKILVHGPGAAAELAAAFPATAGKTVQIPHGHWIGYYRDEVDRAAARRQLGLPEAGRVYLFIGLCKPYKNLHELVRVFRAGTLEGHLLVAGKFASPDYRRRIDEIAAGDARIRIDEGFIPDDSIQHYLRACDYVVVPYREILTSGTAMLALTFGRPVISIRQGFLRDVVAPEAGILFDPQDAEGLPKALGEAARRDFDEAAIVAHARSFSYEEAAQRVIAALT